MGTQGSSRRLDIFKATTEKLTQKFEEGGNSSAPMVPQPTYCATTMVHQRAYKCPRINERLLSEAKSCYAVQKLNIDEKGFTLATGQAGSLI